jgi:hypothetical protein
MCIVPILKERSAIQVYVGLPFRRLRSGQVVILSEIIVLIQNSNLSARIFESAALA